MLIDTDYEPINTFNIPSSWEVLLYIEDCDESRN